MPVAADASEDSKRAGGMCRRPQCRTTGMKVHGIDEIRKKDDIRCTTVNP